MIYVTASIFNGCGHYWHTQLPCIQGSNLYVPNGCAPKINISLLAYLVAVYTRSISLLAYPAVVYTGSGIGLVYPAVVHTRSISLLVYPATPIFFTVYPISHYPRQYALNAWLCTQYQYLLLNRYVSKAL